MFQPEVYDESFYTEAGLMRFETAQEVLSVFFTFFKPKSVVDLGCGLGHWLKVCAEMGIKEIQGFDGHHVNLDALKIPKENFQRHNFEEFLKLEKKFDLAMSIEVAEHLTPDKAETFIKTLVQASDIILFSAAAPHQGGTNHYNEQPPAYWANLFQKEGFVCFDFLRELIWDNKKVNCVHAQNILVFVNESKKSIFEDKSIKTNQNPKLMYHPEFFEIKFKNLLRQNEKKKNKKARTLKNRIKKLLGILEK